MAKATEVLTTALRVLHQKVGVPLEQALAAATRIPAELMGLAGLGRLCPGVTSPLIRISADLSGVDVLS